MVAIPTTLDEQIDVLDVFIESADEIAQSWFLQQVAPGGVGSSFNWAHGGLLQTDRKGPEPEAVKAVLLTIRFFCQSRTERASIENVDNLIQSLNVSQDLKDRFKKSRENFNNYLKSPPNGISFPADSKAATRWAIFDTMLYGRFAHADRSKRKIAKQWETELYYNDLRVQFDLIALEFIKATAVMSSICRDVRKEMPHNKAVNPSGGSGGN